MTDGPPTTRSNKAWLVVITALGAALASALLVGSARSAPQVSGLIAFTRSDGIYAMRADGSGVRPLRRGGVTVGAVDLAWSPDGSKLAFATPLYVANVRQGIWVMDANGANLRHFAAVTRRRRCGSPTWTPDGQRIAFTALTDPEPGKGWPSSGIWVVNLDGSHERRLAPTPYMWAREVDWSPAGSRIAVISDRSLLYVMNRDGRKRHVLSLGWRYEAAAPDWSPNGRRLAFMRLNRYQRPSLLTSEIWVANPNGASRVRLTNNQVPDIYPTWSPDGRKIAFVRGGVVRASDEIFTMSADGTGVTRLTDNRLGEGSPAWQPVVP